MHTTRAPGSLLIFFALTFAVTEACFIAAAALSQGLPAGAGPGLGINALGLLGTFAPAFVALGLTARAEGRDGVRALLGRMFHWQVRARWYVFAVGYFAAIKLAVALLHRWVTGAWPRFGELPWYLMLAATVFSTVVGGQSGEELGWRGYALPRLAARFGLGGASVILGVIWACWHLPLFYLKGADTYGQSFPVFLLQAVAISVAMAWLWWRTNGSLLLTMLMHAAINNTKDIVPSAVRAASDPFALSTSRTAWLSAALLWVAAVYFLVRMRRVTGLEGPGAGALESSRQDAVIPGRQPR
jgi:membrane protease YdiL (CAAX protease family)